MKELNEIALKLKKVAVAARQYADEKAVDISPLTNIEIEDLLKP